MEGTSDENFAAGLSAPMTLSGQPRDIFELPEDQRDDHIYGAPVAASIINRIWIQFMCIFILLNLFQADSLVHFLTLGPVLGSSQCQQSQLEEPPSPYEDDSEADEIDEEEVESKRKIDVEQKFVLNNWECATLVDQGGEEVNESLMGEIASDGTTSSSVDPKRDHVDVEHKFVLNKSESTILVDQEAEEVYESMLEEIAPDGTNANHIATCAALTDSSNTNPHVASSKVAVSALERRWSMFRSQNQLAERKDSKSSHFSSRDVSSSNSSAAAAELTPEVPSSKPSES